MGSAMYPAAVIGLGIAGLYVLHYWKNLAYRRFYKSDDNLAGKTIIVTGGNSGIGKVAAMDLARRGARVILACRSLQKAEETSKEIKTRTGNSEVVVRHLDLASLQSVREFADQTNEEENRLDILINNAGTAVLPTNTVTKDNFHMLFGTNHFGHFLLTNLLLDLLKKSAPSRVLTVSSSVHVHVCAQLDFTRNAVQGDGGVLYPYMYTYAQSKLANILFSRELARRLEPTGVASVSLHPGLIYTSIWKSILPGTVFTPLYYILSPLIWLFCLDEKTGAQTTLHCALDESVPHLSGQYFTNCTVAEPSAMAQDDELARRLWEVSCKATGFEDN